MPAIARLVACILLLTAGSASAQEPLLGDWWLSMRGKDKGALSLNFVDAGGGSFTVTGLGASLAFESLFQISAGQTLVKNSAGDITGTLAIEDLGGTPLGAIVVDKGKVDDAGEKLKLRGRMTGAAPEDLKVKLKGSRFPATFPVLTGRDREARVKGKGVKSKAFDLTVREHPTLPFPAFEFTGSGPVEIDDVETPGVTADGSLVLDPREKVVGVLASPELGSGGVRGRLRSGDSAPRANLKADTGRRFKLKGDLEEAVSPILSVTPPDPVDFGTVQIGMSADQTFVVTNAGVGTLNGDATISGSPSPFTVVSGSPYSLGAGAMANVVVRFSPTVEGSASDQLVFTGGGGAIRNLTGVGGALSVTPTSLAFGDVMVGNSATLQFTVRNEGTMTLTGSATVTTGKPDFELVDAGGTVQTEVTYSLTPGQTATVTVRFQPAATGAKSGQVTFTSGSVSVIRDVSGNGT